MTNTVTYKGFTFGVRTRDAVVASEELHGSATTIFQGSYHVGTPQSAGTHDRDGAIDIEYTGDDLIGDWRRQGWAIWHRLPLPGVWGEHAHGILIGTTELAWLARAQVSAYYAGRDGLADNGPDNTPNLRPDPIPVFGTDSAPKPPPSRNQWVVWSGYPGKQNTGWGEGRSSIWNLRMQASLGVRGYVGAFPSGITRTWTTQADSALKRWQDRHPTGGNGFDETAWNTLGLLPTFAHDSFDRTRFKVGTVSWESAIVQMLLILAGQAEVLDYEAHRTWSDKAVTAVKGFQKAHGLTVDGVVGPITWTALWEAHQ